MTELATIRVHADHGPTGMPLRTVYVTSPRYRIFASGGYLIFRSGTDKRLIGKMPLMQVRQLVLMEHVEVSSGVLRSCLGQNIPVTFMQGNGELSGHLLGARSHDATARLEQYRAYLDPARKLATARNFARAKIDNSIAVIRRYLYNHPQDQDAPRLRAAVSAMKEQGRKAVVATNADELRGHEGVAAKAYFEVFGMMLRQNFHFSGRSRRPPKDPVNALLSFGYTILAYEAAAMVEAVGLDSYIGFLHEPSSGRPSLGLDLIEPLRSMIIDRLVISGINVGKFVHEDFKLTTGGDGAVLLNPEGRQKFFESYEGMMAGIDEDFPGADGKISSPRRVMEEECQAFKQALLAGREGEWRPRAIGPQREMA